MLHTRMKKDSGKADRRKHDENMLGEETGDRVQIQRLSKKNNIERNSCNALKRNKATTVGGGGCGGSYMTCIVFSALQWPSS